MVAGRQVPPAATINHFHIRCQGQGTQAVASYAGKGQIEQGTASALPECPTCHGGMQPGERVRQGIAAKERRIADGCTGRNSRIIAKGDPLRLRFAAAITRNADPGETFPPPHNVFSIYVHLPQCARTRGFDDDVGLFDQGSQLLASLVASEIDRHALLARVKQIIEVAIAAAGAVGALRILDFDDPCTRLREQMSAQRACPERGDIHDQRRSVCG